MQIFMKQQLGKRVGSVLAKRMFLANVAGDIGAFLDSAGNKIGLQHS
jgi:hypothetical protein